MVQIFAEMVRLRCFLTNKEKGRFRPSALGIFILFHVLPDKALNVALHVALTKKIFE